MAKKNEKNIKENLTKIDKINKKLCKNVIRTFNN